MTIVPTPPFEIAPGQKKTISAKFLSNATPPAVIKLKSVPTCVDKSSSLIITPTAAHTVDDPEFVWDMECPKNAVGDKALSVVISGVHQNGKSESATVTGSIIDPNGHQIVVAVSP